MTAMPSVTIDPNDDVRPDYFAVPDPLDPTKLSYWYRPKRGRKAGRLQPWPPRRNDWGALYRTDVLAQPPEERDEYRIAHWKRIRAGREEVTRVIEADPTLAAARFAECHSICCCCGKSLTDERSKAYGVGPDCRSGLRPEALAALIAKMAEVHAAGRVSWRVNGRDDPALFDGEGGSEQ
jgi:Family of unknown function (DUF6011)